MIRRRCGGSVLLGLIPLASIHRAFKDRLAFGLSCVQAFAMANLLLLLYIFFGFAGLLLGHVCLQGGRVGLEGTVNTSGGGLIVRLLLRLALLIKVDFLLTSYLLRLATNNFSRLFSAALRQGLLFDRLYVVTNVD